MDTAFVKMLTYSAQLFIDVKFEIENAIDSDFQVNGYFKRMDGYLHLYLSFFSNFLSWIFPAHCNNAL